MSCLSRPLPAASQRQEQGRAASAWLANPQSPGWPPRAWVSPALASRPGRQQGVRREHRDSSKSVCSLPKGPDPLRVTGWGQGSEEPEGGVPAVCLRGAGFCGAGGRGLALSEVGPALQAEGCTKSSLRCRDQAGRGSPRGKPLRGAVRLTSAVTAPEERSPRRPLQDASLWMPLGGVHRVLVLDRPHFLLKGHALQQRK